MLRRCFSGCVVIGLAAACALAAEAWPEFRGPHGDGHADATDLPTTFGERDHVKWKTAVHGKAWSSPVLNDRQAWLTTATEDGKELGAVGIDRESGKIVHDITVFTVEKPQFCHPFNSYASSTPALEPGRIYAHYGSAGTACLDTATGRKLWERRDLPCDHFRGAGSSPILYRDLLLVSFDGFDEQYVVALDKNTGKTVWKRDRKIEYGTSDGDAKKAYSTATIVDVDGQPQLVSSSAGATLAYEPTTGDEIWRVRHGGMNAATRPVYAHGLVYLNTAAGGDKLLAVRPTGRGDVTSSHVEWRYGQGIPTRSSQLIIGDLLYMVSDAGVAACVEAKTGRPVWQHRLEGKYTASPLYADGKIYFFSEDGFCPVIAPGSTFQLLATNQLDGGCMASPAAADHALYVRTRTHLYRIEK